MTRIIDVRKAKIPPSVAPRIVPMGFRLFGLLEDAVVGGEGEGEDGNGDILRNLRWLP
jgi:hypothetical protein